METGGWMLAWLHLDQTAAFGGERAQKTELAQRKESDVSIQKTTWTRAKRGAEAMGVANGRGLFEVRPALLNPA